MTARAMWKGVLRLESAAVPVRLYAGLEERGVHFRLVDRESGEPVEQRMVDPLKERVVQPQEIRKAYEADDGSFVVLSAEELEGLLPTPSRDIAVTRFVPLGTVPRSFYVRPYFLGPDGRAGPYFALAQALEAEKVEGIAHWFLRKHQYDGVLRVVDGYLSLITLRKAEEVIRATELPRPSGRAPTDKEARMARQLIDAYTDQLEIESLRDTYRERVLKLVARKAAGKRVQLKKAAPKQMEGNLAEALAMTLKQAKKARRVA